MTDMTAREVTAAGEALALIVSEARAQVGEARSALESVAGTKSSEGVAPLLAEQAQSTERYLDEVARLTEQQRDATRRAMSLSKRIVDLGEQITTVSFDVRLLSLNASIESARLGEHGHAFRVIATEMKRLRELVDATNGLVAEVAKEVVLALPAIDSGAEELQRCSQEFSQRSRVQLQRVDEEGKRMERRASSSLSSGEARLQSILAASSAALSHLQFQDPCAQSLRIVEADIAQAAARVAAAVEGADVGDARVRQLDEAFVGSFQAATSNRASNAGEVVALSGDTDAPDAGEVMLF